MFGTVLNSQGFFEVLACNKVFTKTEQLDTCCARFKLFANALIVSEA